MANSERKKEKFFCSAELKAEVKPELAAHMKKCRISRAKMCNSENATDQNY